MPNWTVIISIVVFTIAVIAISIMFSSKCTNPGEEWKPKEKVCGKVCYGKETWRSDNNTCSQCGIGFVLGTDGKCTNACHTGEETCGGQCYNPASQACYKDKVYATSDKCGDIYCEDTKICDHDTKKCVKCGGKNTVVCGHECMDTTKSKCIDGKPCVFANIKKVGTNDVCCSSEQLCGPNCCPSGQKCVDKSKGICAVPCGDKYCDDTQMCLTDDTTKRGYCSKKGCAWNNIKYDPPTLNNAAICRNPANGEQIFCDSNGSSVNYGRTASCLPSSTPDKCDIQSCENRLNQGGPNGFFSPKISYVGGVCTATDDCSQVLPKCAEVKKLPFTDRLERLCKDNKGVYTGKICPDKACVDGVCTKWAYDKATLDCKPSVDGPFYTKEICDNAIKSCIRIIKDAGGKEYHIDICNGEKLPKGFKVGTAHCNISGLSNCNCSEDNIGLDHYDIHLMDGVVCPNGYSLENTRDDCDHGRRPADKAPFLICN